MFAAVATVAVAGSRPNIILAMADDMGWGDPSYNSLHVTYTDGTPHPDQGWISTPTMDAMAASGIRFDRFYSAAPVCSPTRASCLTGRNPYRLGITKANVGRMGLGETPLSEILSNAGYRCGHFGKWHVGTLTTLRNDANRGAPGNTSVYSAPWHHGYDVCFATESKVPTWHPYRVAENGAALPTSFDDPNFFGTHYWRMPVDGDYANAKEGDPVPVDEINNAVDGDDSRMLAGQAINFIRRSVSNSEPFFLVLWFHTPHKPLVDPNGVEAIDSSAACKAAIEDMDEALGMVRDELTALGVRDNTMFWMTSDNGPEKGVDSPNETDVNRPLRAGLFRDRKRWLYDGGVRVPGILEWPNVVTNNFVTDYPAVTSDYYPTILDYLGLSAPTQRPLDGISLRPVIEGTAVARPKPMGFLYPGTASWVADRYKIIRVDDPTTSAPATDGWELYDMDNIEYNADVETNAIATASTIGSQTPEIQAVYNSMIAEYNAWRSSVSSDSSYIYATQPTVVLSTASDSALLPFTVSAQFSEAVQGLGESDFVIENGSITNLIGDGTNWTFMVVPEADGAVKVSLPEGAAFDADGTLSAKANTLSVLYGLPFNGELVETNLTQVVWQTVDYEGNVPGNLDNNLEKFFSPYATTLYARGNGSIPLRRTRAFTRFDLSALAGKTITSAHLEFNGYSLNDNTAANLEVVALASDWAVSGTPLPTFDHAAVGSAVSGGNIITDLGSGNAKDYSVDVSDMVANWVSGTWTNYGMRIQLSDFTADNGLGVKTSDTGAIQLCVSVYSETTGLQLSPASELAMRLEAPAAVATKPIDISFVYGSDSNNLEITSVDVIQQQHAGAFRVVDFSVPQTLTSPAPATVPLNIEFNVAGTGLLEGQTSTGLVQVVWNEIGGSDCTNSIAVTASYEAHIDENSLLHNNFDGDSSNDIGPGFKISSINAPQNTGLADASTGVISFSAPSDSRPNVTLISTSALDLSMNEGFTVIWDLGSIVSDAFSISKNGLFLGVQNNNSDAWNNLTSLGLGIRSSAGIGDLDLICSKSGTKGSESPLLALGALTDASIQDGFRAILTVNNDNTWTVSTTGLSTNVNASGTLGTVTYSDLAGSLFASTALQLNKDDALHTLTYNSASVLAVVDEPAALLLSPSDQLDIDLLEPATLATGSVDVAFSYGSGGQNVQITSATVTEQQHAGVFRVVGFSGVELTDPASGETLNIEFDVAGTGLTGGETSTGLLEVVWNEIGGENNTSTLPVSATVCAPGVIWTDGLSFLGGDNQNNISMEGVLIKAVNLGGNLGDLDVVVDKGTASETITFVDEIALFPNSAYDAVSPGTSDDNWNSVIFRSDYKGNESPFEFNLSDLIIGWKYQVEFFVWDTRNSSIADRTYTIDDGEGNSSAVHTQADGVSVICTFTADAETQTFRISQSAGSPSMNAYVLRAISNAGVPGAVVQVRVGIGSSINLSASNLNASTIYTLQGRTNLLQGIWEGISSTTGVTQADWVDLASTNGSMFYRIHAFP
ncbi:Arylsulfatase [Pontiella sulfatireligans]|uniref:Arylsulfatase n=2 Tax=Pontiella sulfatireligans TaxID=2750658 RepID=A0A6C2UFE6_9BACT|nr:sulfatase S1_23 [Kiritimatiellales bacterium]VGO18838.1 Arylsulfatase [Pontiella sulfatireligans]